MSSYVDILNRIAPLFIAAFVIIGLAQSLTRLYAKRAARRALTEKMSIELDDLARKLGEDNLPDTEYAIAQHRILSSLANAHFQYLSHVKEGVLQSNKEARHSYIRYLLMR